MKRLSIAALFILLIATIAPRADAAEGAAGCGTGLLEGKRITVEVEGDGPDVVLIPGLSSPRAVWAPTAERLKTTHRLHLVEVRGFGGDAPGPIGGEKLQIVRPSPCLGRIFAGENRIERSLAAVILPRPRGHLFLMPGDRAFQLRQRRLVLGDTRRQGLFFRAQPLQLACRGVGRPFGLLQLRLGLPTARLGLAHFTVDALHLALQVLQLGAFLPEPLSLRRPGRMGGHDGRGQQNEPY